MSKVWDFLVTNIHWIAIAAIFFFAFWAVIATDLVKTIPTLIASALG